MLDEQEPIVQSADRTKEVQVWPIRKVAISITLYLIYRYLKTSIGKYSGFHARKNPKQEYHKVVTFSNDSSSKKSNYVYDLAA